LFYQASSFNQQLCWDTSKTLDPHPPLSNVFVGAGSDAKFLSYPACAITAAPVKKPATVKKKKNDGSKGPKSTNKTNSLKATKTSKISKRPGDSKNPKKMKKGAKV
jgi:hypothetical protein